MKSPYRRIEQSFRSLEKNGDSITFFTFKTNLLKIEFILDLYNLNVDFHFRHSLSAGGRGASSASPSVSPLDALIPQESRTFRSNQLCFTFR